MNFKQIIGMVLLVIFAFSVVVPAALADDFDDILAIDDKMLKLYGDFETIMVSKVAPVVDGLPGASISGVKSDLEKIKVDIDKNIKEYQKYPKSMVAYSLTNADLFKDEVNAAIDAVEYLEKEASWDKAITALGDELDDEDLAGIKKERKVLEDLAPVLFAAREGALEMAGFGASSPDVSGVFNMVLASVNDDLFLDFDSTKEFDDVEEMMNKTKPFIISDLFIDAEETYPAKVSTLKTELAEFKAGLNTELCAGKDGKLYKLALDKLRIDADNFAEEAADDAETAKENFYTKLEVKFELLQKDFEKVEDDAKAAAAVTKGENCGTTTPPPANNTPTDEWKLFDQYDADFEAHEDDYYDYKKKYEKAKYDNDSKDIKKYDNKLDDLENDVDDTIDDVEDLIDVVEKKKEAVKDYKKLLNKLDDLVDDLDDLKDDIDAVLKGKTSASSTSSSVNFVPAKTTSVPTKTTTPAVNTVTFTPPVAQQPVAAAQDDFVELALLGGGVLVVGVLILFLLAMLFLRK